MRSGILSINIYTERLNYGAVLHSWCFQKLMLRRDDMESCEIIDYPQRAINYDPRYRFLPRNPLKQPMELVKYALVTPGLVRRGKKFQAFFKKHLVISERKYSHQTLGEAQLPYDVLFFESDVIWSPRYFGGRFNPAFFGALPSMWNKRKIVYAASLGDADLSSDNLNELRKLLAYPDAISIRERYASEIVRAQTSKPVADVIDPVLLAEPEDFEEITAPRRIKDRYLLMYYPVRPGDQVIRCARQYARARGLKLVKVSIYPDFRPGCRTLTSAGIEEFVSLVRHSEAVFCNSVHGVCLALLFHKEFYAFSHSGGGLKYREICSKFGLDSRYIGSNPYREDDPIDWNRVDRLRQRYKRESLEWLDRAIKGD